MFTLEFNLRFPEVELMNALGVIFPQYWLQANCDNLFVPHVKTLQSHFAILWTMNFGTKDMPNLQQIQLLIDGHLLSLQMSLFKLTMKSHVQGAMDEPQDQNPIIKVKV